MAKQIANLNDMQAVYSLHRLASKQSSGIDLDNTMEVKKFVEDAARDALGNEQAQDFMKLFKSDKSAGDLARACLVSVQKDSELIEGASGELDTLLLNPPETRQMDGGIGLGLLALAGLAMFLSGTLKIKTKDGGEFVYEGSEQVTEIFKTVLNLVPGWKKG